MRIFNFLLATDVVGGVGPPADLINTTANDGDWLLVFFLVLGYALGIATTLIIKKMHPKNDKDENNKGDE